MNDKQALVDLFNKTEYMKYDEALALLRVCFPEDIKLIEQMLTDDLREFKLKVYFWKMYGDSGTIDLLIPECATLSSLNHFVSAYEYIAYFWQFGDLSTKELKEWLQKKGFSSASLEIKALNTPAYMDTDHELFSHKLAAAVKAWEYFNANGLIHPKKSPKQNIIEWLTNNAFTLGLIHNKQVSGDAIEDIAKVVNWQTKGGAPKS